MLHDVGTISNPTACHTNSSMCIVMMHSCVIPTPRQVLLRLLLLLLLQGANIIHSTTFPATPPTTAAAANTLHRLATLCGLCTHITAVAKTHLLLPVPRA
jgi:hypothetical protein